MFEHKLIIYANCRRKELSVKLRFNKSVTVPPLQQLSSPLSLVLMLLPYDDSAPPPGMLTHNSSNAFGAVRPTHLPSHEMRHKKVEQR